MISHIPLRHFPPQQQPLKISARLAAIGQRGIADEAEAAVVGGIAEQDAAVGIQFREAGKSLADQRAADALALQVGCDGDRAEAVPASCDAGDLHR